MTTPYSQIRYADSIRVQDLAAEKAKAEAETAEKPFSAGHENGQKQEEA